MTGRGSLLALALLAVGGAPLRAQVEPLETHIQVRVLAGDAKLIGDVVGGARVKIVDARSGEILAEGVTTGDTGDTERIMGTPRTRGATVFDTPGAAGWLARFPLEAPTVVRIEAEGPLGFPHAVARASRTMVLEPGTRIVGEGIVLELNGLLVEILEAGSDAAEPTVAVRARVRMLCSCPTEPDGLWSVEHVAARLVADGAVVARGRLRFAGTPSEYSGEVRMPEPGRYTLEVIASDPATANFGVASREIEPTSDNRTPGGLGPSSPSGSAPASGSAGSVGHQIARLVNPYAEMDHFAGTLLVASGDEILVHEAWGLANRGLGVPNTTNTRFRIGSITKDFTAALVRSLEEASILSQDDPLARFLPEFARADRIRLRHLLDHTHGVPNWRSLPQADALNATGVSLAEAVAALAEQEPEFAPGARRQYGSSGHLLVAHVIEVATGRPYHVELRERVLAPLGLENSGSLEGMEIVSALAEAYVPTGSAPWLERAAPTHPSITSGSASAYSTAGDLFRWTRSEAAAGIDWGASSEHGRPMRWTSGFTAGFISRIHHFQDEDITLVLLSNLFTPAFRPILRDAAGILFGLEVEPVTVWTPVELDPGERAALVGAWRCESGLDFRIESGSRGLELVVDAARFPLVPLAPQRLHLPNDYADLSFFGPSPQGFGRVRYDGGFSTGCLRDR